MIVLRARLLLQCHQKCSIHMVTQKRPPQSDWEDCWCKCPYLNWYSWKKFCPVCLDPSVSRVCVKPHSGRHRCGVDVPAHTFPILWPRSHYSSISCNIIIISCIWITSEVITNCSHMVNNSLTYGRMLWLWSNNDEGCWSIAVVITYNALNTGGSREANVRSTRFHIIRFNVCKI